ncbi:hypothetical protein CPT_Privateer_029 [Proteus phage Privateer]|uniref:Uncharacterized protein n=1 Tax=Proteus phage Privateer TaxID=2712958 RepID=A0A6G8R3P9_9CAUD|nr:hypothetical protein HWD17_gp029 [Proteus phage Privateer]QIN94822.1 hypothetical protein CPT_Privateer_029 [Proteus phage Privateer]
MKKVKDGYECQCKVCEKIFLIKDPLTEGFNFCKDCGDALIKKYKPEIDKEIKDLPF